MEEKPDYGINDPVIIMVFAPLSIAFAFVLIFVRAFWIALISVIIVVVSTYMWFPTVLGSTHSAKIKLREELLGAAHLRGNQRILDVGTGRGLLATGFAKALEGSRIVGVDIWDQQTLLGNRIQNALRNARLEGVSDRVRFGTADARRLPFRDGSFDMVVGSWVLHNVGRRWRHALAEMLRVLSPKGELLLTVAGLGPWGTRGELVQGLRTSGLVGSDEDIQFRPLGLVYGIPRPAIMSLVR